MLQVIGLAKRFGAEAILQDVSFIINTGERVGLIGPNGSGKSTILRCIAGADSPDRGQIVRAPLDLRVGYLPQALAELGDLTVGGVLDLAQAEAIEAERGLEAAARLLASDASEAAMVAYEQALARFEALGGYGREQRAEAVLSGLGLANLSLALPLSELSGGEKTRLGLAGLLLGEPDLLLLDEPTNHLDVAALEWLERFVAEFRGAVLIVSHDREFLDRTVERVLYLDPASGSVTSYPGGYTAFTEVRRHERELQEQAWVTQEKYVGQVQSDISRLKGAALAVELATTPRQPGVRRRARLMARVAKSREKKLARYLDDEERVETTANYTQPSARDLEQAVE